MSGWCCFAPRIAREDCASTAPNGSVQQNTQGNGVLPPKRDRYKGTENGTAAYDGPDRSRLDFGINGAVLANGAGSPNGHGLHPDDFKFVNGEATEPTPMGRGYQSHESSPEREQMANTSISFRTNLNGTAQPATLEELSSRFKRNVYDPENPMGRQSLETPQTGPQDGRHSGSTPSPKTPLQTEETEHGQRDDSNFERTDSDDSAATKDEPNLMTTRSTLSCATSRPQPVSELQGLLGVSLGGIATEVAQSEQLQLTSSFTSRQSGCETPALKELSLRLSGGQSLLGQQENVSSTPRRKENGHSTPRHSRSSSLTSRSVTKAMKQSFGLSQQDTGTPVWSVRAVRDPAGLDDCPLNGHHQYRVIEKLENTARNLFLCQDLHHHATVIVKLLARGPSNAKAAEQEIESLRLCARHPHMIHMHEVFLMEKHIGIAVEYAEGGKLADYIKRHQSSKYGKGISEERAKWLFYQIAIAVDFCHKQNIANREIKIDNVLLVSNGPEKSTIPTVKLGNFGFGAEDQAEPLHGAATGAAQFLAPEVIAGGLYDGGSSDVWSMGVLLFAMLTGNYPFSRLSDKEMDQREASRKLFGRIMHATYEMPQHISSNAQDLLQNMLKEEPSERIKMDGIMSHAFFTSDRKKSKMHIINHSLLQSTTNLSGVSTQEESEVHAMLKEASKTPSRSRTG